MKVYLDITALRQHVAHPHLFPSNTAGWIRSVEAALRDQSLFSTERPELEELKRKLSGLPPEAPRPWGIGTFK